MGLGPIKKAFVRQWFTNWLRPTLAFMRYCALLEGLTSTFQEFFDIINKILILTGTITTMLSFYEF